MASPDAAPEPSCVHVTLAVNGAQAAAAGQQLVSCDVSLQAMPSPWQVQRPVGDGTGDEGDVGAGGEDVELTVGSVTSAHAGAVEALKAARTDVQGLREERAAMVAQVTTSESSRALNQLSATLAAERTSRFEAELRLRSELASLQAERDTLAARVATLERERSQLSDLGRHAKPPPGGPSSADASSSPSWWAWLKSGEHDSAGDVAVAAVQRHLVTVTTDRDLLAGDLYRCMLDRTAALRDRDAALAALREATAGGAAASAQAASDSSTGDVLHLSAPDAGPS